MMKAFRWCAMTAFVLLCCAYTPIEHSCVLCQERTHYSSLMDYVASNFSKNYAHASCAGWKEKVKND